MENHVQTYHVKDIPVTTYSTSTDEKKPVIFALHGYSCTKRQNKELAELLASEGYFVITFDAYMHGERLDDRLVMPSEDKLLYDMYEIVKHTLDDVNTLINHFTNHREADVNRIGMTGISMGGFSTFYTVVNQPKIKVAVPMIASPAFYNIFDMWLERLKKSKNEDSYPNAMKRNTTEWRIELKNMDPLDKLPKLPQIPLLMINGRRDKTIPTSHVKQLYNNLKPRYQVSEKLKLSIYDEEHIITKAMVNEAVTWFKRYLR